MIDLNKVYFEDCLTGMELIPPNSVDMIFADLPYGSTKLPWDKIIPWEPLWAHYLRIIKPNGAMVFTAQQPFATDLINSQRSLFRYYLAKNHETGLSKC